MLEQQHQVSEKEQKVNCAHQHIGSIAGEGKPTDREGKNQQNRIRRVEPKDHCLSGDQADAQHCGNSQPDRRQHRTQEDVDGTLQIVGQRRAGGAQRLRRQNERRH